MTNKIYLSLSIYSVIYMADTNEIRYEYMMLIQCTYSEFLNFTIHVTAKIKWRCLYMLLMVSLNSQNKTTWR